MKLQKTEQQIADMLAAEISQRLLDEPTSLAGFVPWVFWHEPEASGDANWGARYHTREPVSPLFHAAWLEALKTVRESVDLALPLG